MLAEGQVTRELDGAGNRSGWTLLTRHGLVMACITRYPGRGTAEIAKRLGLREGTVSQIVVELVEEGRVRSRKAGRRSFYHRVLAASLSG